MMADSNDTRVALERSFKEYGFIYNRDIIDKFIELCATHGINNAEELADEWMAFSLNSRGNPTLQHLAKFEREVFIKKKTLRNNVNSCESTLNVTDADSSEILSAYSTKPQGLITTPNSRKGNLISSEASRTCFSPASFSPTATTSSSRYEARHNAGTIMCNRAPTGLPSPPWPSSVTVKKISGLNDDQKFMAFQLTDYADATEKHVCNLISHLSSRYSLEEIVPVNSKYPTTVVTAGRVICDADGKLNSESTLLESSPDSGGETARLDLSGVPSHTVFPGQVVALSGINMNGSKFIAQKIWSDASLPDPPPPIDLPGSLNIVIAAGPFTTSDSLACQPLLDLIDIVVKEEPHLLILTGPLIDSEHAIILQNSIAESFTDLFERLITKFMEPLARLTTEVVFVSSYRDCNGAAVFPTPAHSLSKPCSKLTFLPDPCMINVNGVLISITSIDILMHLGKEESSLPGYHGGDRLTRLASYIIQQQSIYPLRPPPIEVPLDPTLESHLKLSQNPHILILPSDLRCFIKDVAGVTVVNPEHLAKGLVGGSYAKLTVSTNGEIYGQVIKI